MEELRDRVYDFVNELSDSDIVNINNDYVDPYNTIYFLDEYIVNDYLYDVKPIDILRDYDWIDMSYEFISFDREVCTDYLDDFISTDEIVDYILENDDDLGFSELRDILDEGDDESDTSNYEDLDDEARFEDEY